MDNDNSRPPRALLIEDDHILSNMYSEKFRLSGIDVIIADDGEAGLAAAKNEKPDIILLDMHLPKLNGMAILMELTKNVELKNTPIIALTNIADQENAEKARALGVKEYMIKAMSDPEKVVETVRKYLPR